MVTIEETKDLDNMKIEELQSTLEAHEMKIAEREIEKQDEHTLFSKFYKLEASKDKWKDKSKKHKYGEDKPETSHKKDEKTVKHQKKEKIFDKRRSNVIIMKRWVTIQKNVGLEKERDPNKVKKKSRLLKKTLAHIQIHLCSWLQLMMRCQTLKTGILTQGAVTT